MLNRLVYIVFPMLFISFLSCENDINTITSLSQVDSLPEELAREIRVVYSDSGRMKAVLESPYMKKYEQKDPFYEFPAGFRVIFYDSAMKPQTEITARYGIRNERTKIMEAKNNVVVKSINKQEQLDTEHLIWDEIKRTIYSEVFVKITRPDRVIYGDGLTSDQDFSNYTIKNLKGEFQVDPGEQ
jgi:LPS export ABC transporter protein LptC